MCFIYSTIGVLAFFNTVMLSVLIKWFTNWLNSPKNERFTLERNNVPFETVSLTVAEHPPQDFWKSGNLTVLWLSPWKRWEGLIRVVPEKSVLEEQNPWQKKKAETSMFLKEAKRQKTTKEWYILLENQKKVKLQKQDSRGLRLLNNICRAAYLKWLLTETMSLLLHQTKLVFKDNLSYISDGVCQLIHWHHHHLQYFVCISPSASQCIFSHLIFHLVIFSHPRTDVTGIDIFTRHFFFSLYTERLIDISALHFSWKKLFGNWYSSQLTD